jgi:hypothetical protein
VESRVERVLEAVDGPFNGTGSMRPAFTTRSDGWDSLTRTLPAVELARLASEREGERLALLAWVRAGADRGAFDRDEYDAGAGLAGQPVTPELMPGPGRVRIRTLIERRCVTCHSDTGREDRARLKPFDTYDRLRPVISSPPDPQMPRGELARRTSVRLPIFALLFAVTGVMFGFSGVAGWVRRTVAPLPLAGLVAAVACTWLARWDPVFVWGVGIGEVVIGLGFALHLAVGLGELARCGCGRTAEGVKCERPFSSGR